MIRWTALALLGLFAPFSARADWYAASTKHFVVLSDDQPDKLTAVATELEQYDAAMRVFRHIPNGDVAPASRVTVYVLHSPSDLAVMPEGVAGFYSPRISYSVAFTPRQAAGYANGGSRVRPDAELMLQPMPVLRHEYAHHFMFNNYEAAAMPLWLTEGFAEFNATASRNPDGSVTFGQVPIYRGSTFAYSHGCTVEQVLTTSDLEKLHNCNASDVYAYGWLLTDYLTFTPGGWKQLGGYVDAINKGKSMADAAAAFGDLHALSRALDQQINGRKLPSFAVPASSIQIGSPALRKLSPGEAAMMSIRIRSEAGVTEHTAPGVYKRAAAVAQEYPADAAVQRELAEAAYDAKQYDVAETAARQAFTLDPTSASAADYIGRAKLARAVGNQPDRAMVAEARGWFARANKLDPTNAEPLTLFYRSFVVAGESPTHNAKQGLLGAVTLAPQAQELRLYAAYACLFDGEGLQARRYLTALAYNPHATKGRVKLARDTQALIDQGNLSGAAAKLLPIVRNPDAKLGDKGDGMVDLLGPLDAA